MGDFSPPFALRKGSEQRAAGDCAAAVEAARKGFETVNPVDAAPFRVSAMKCAAMEAVRGARASKASNWGEGSGGVLERVVAGWGKRETVVARGDFDGDGVEDRMIEAEEWAEKGTARRVRIVIMTVRQAGGKPEVIREIEF